MDEKEDIKCPACGFKNLSTESIQKIQENAEEMVNS
jgi:hypothetical protein